MASVLNLFNLSLLYQVFLGQAWAAAPPHFSELEALAAQSLSSNIIAVGGASSYLRAGSHQFGALWTRDFCFASRGLLAIRRPDVVRAQLELLLDSPRASDAGGMLPKYFDSVSIWFRYAALTAGRIIPLKEPLKPGFLSGVPPSPSVDSNILVLLTALDYVQATGDEVFWAEHELQLKQVFHAYDRLVFRPSQAGSNPALIRQGAYADWQDSVKREGFTFYTNILYYVAAHRLLIERGWPIAPEFLTEFRNLILQTFLDPATKLFFSVAGQPQISLDGNLLAIDLGFLAPKDAPSAPTAQALYAHLKLSPLWTRNPGFPGFNAYPDYPPSEVNWLVKSWGIPHYHDEVYWSWLIALSAKVAREMGDDSSANLILSRFQEMAVRDGSIAEVYDAEAPFLPYSGGHYRSETPFSWGAGMALEALHSVHTGQ